MTKRDILNDFGSKVITQVIREQAALGIRASGESARSLKSETSFDGLNEVLTIRGEERFEQQEHGRGPTRKRGPKLRESDIVEWMRFRPAFAALSEAEKFRVAGAIIWGPRGLHNEGSALYQSLKGTYRGDHNPKPLEFTRIALDNLEEVKGLLAGAQIQELRSEVLRIWKDGN